MAQAWTTTEATTIKRNLPNTPERSDGIDLSMHAFRRIAGDIRRELEEMQLQVLQIKRGPEDIASIDDQKRTHGSCAGKHGHQQTHDTLASVAWSSVAA